VGDVTLDLAAVRAWDADGVAHAATGLRAAAEALDSTYDRLRAVCAEVAAGWTGSAASVAHDRLGLAAVVASRLGCVVREIAGALAGGTGAVQEAAYLAQRATDGGDAGAGTTPSWGAAGGPLACRALTIAADADHRTAAGLAAGLTAPLAGPRRTPASGPGGSPWPTAVPLPIDGSLLTLGAHASFSDVCAALGLRRLEPPTPLPAPPTGGSAASVAAWWLAVPRDIRMKLVQEQPWSLGDLPGLPAEIRDASNRSRLAALLRTLRADQARSSGPVLADAATVPLAAVVRGRLRIAEEVERQLTRLAREGRAAQLLTLDLDGSGRAAIVVGDLDTAAHVALVVPGLNQDVVRGLGRTVDHAVTLRDQAQREAGSDRSVAVIAWVAYPAPGLAQVALLDRARTGGRLLGRELDGLAAARSGDPPHTTVVGHSYGSTTVGAAATTRWLEADDLVFLGSPGVLASGVEQLGRSGAHVFVGEANFDGVGDLAVFGADPATASFGATRFRADPDGSWLRRVWGDHSRYFDPGSESLRNLARIVAGHAERITRERPEMLPSAPQGELCPGPC
jgi:uncharacterized protein YukE